MRKSHSLRGALLCALALLVPSCAIPPAKPDPDHLIKHFFEAKGYGVDRLTIDDVRCAAPSHSGRNGKECTVKISSIILRPFRDFGEPWNYKKGAPLTFKDAVVLLTDDTSGSEHLAISEIAGINAP